MFRAETINKIEHGRNSLDNTGGMLEQEFLGAVNTRKYKEMAYAVLHKDELKDKEGESPEERYEKILSMREKAKQEFAGALHLADRSKYIDYENSMQLIEETQVGDPEKPKQFFAKKLHEYIKGRFEDKYTLKFFTCTGGTHLDVYHGVDFFFKLYDKESGKELTQTTIDLTMNPKKDEIKADVLVYIDDRNTEKYDNSKGNEEYNEEFINNKISEFGEEIINSLIENYKRSK